MVLGRHPIHAHQSVVPPISEEVVADRDERSHAVIILDMNAKYADVVSCAELSRYLAALPAVRKTNQ